MQRDVVLYSGGLDSYVLWETLKVQHTTVKDPVRVFIYTGTGDNQKEAEHIMRQQGSPKDLLSLKLPLHEIELGNKIVPFRNFLFVLLAANLGNRIHIGVTIGDTTRDKDYVFKGICDTMLNYFGQVHGKMPYYAEQFSVEMPFKQMTKTEIVRLFIKNGGDPEVLALNTRSCYENNTLECGGCRACLRKLVAFENNGMGHRLNFLTRPTTQDVIEFYRESSRKNRHQKELEETYKATQSWR